MLFSCQYSRKAIIWKTRSWAFYQCQRTGYFYTGGHGQPAEIFVNGQQASTKSLIKTGDAIQLIEGLDGQQASATVRDLIDEAAIKTVTIQNTKYVIEPKITVNTSSASLETVLNDRDIVVLT